MADGAPETYAELVQVLDALPILVREKRRRVGLSQRAASRRAGVEEMTVMRLERGEHLSFRAVRAILLWLGAPAVSVTAEDERNQPVSDPFKGPFPTLPLPVPPETVALLRMPIPLGSLGSVVSGLKGTYGDGLVIRTDTNIDGWMVIARALDIPEEKPE